MSKHHLLTPILLGLGLLVLANLVPQTAAAAQAPGTARVWFLRSAGSLNGNVWAAEPEICANGAPVGDLPVGSKFYRDFRPGTYRFTVQAYGLPTVRPIPYIWHPEHRPISKSNGWQAGRRVTPRPIIALRPIPLAFGRCRLS